MSKLMRSENVHPQMNIYSMSSTSLDMLTKFFNLGKKGEGAGSLEEFIEVLNQQISTIDFTTELEEKNSLNISGPHGVQGEGAFRI